MSQTSTVYKQFLVACLVYLFQAMAIPLSYLALSQSGEGNGDLLLPVIVLISSLPFLVRTRKSKRSLISIFTMTNALGAILLSALDMNSFMSTFLFVCILFFSISASALYVYLQLQKNDGKKKLRFHNDQPLTVQDKVSEFKKELGAIKQLWVNRKEHGVFRPLIEWLMREKEQDVESMVFTLGREVDYHSGSFKRERT